MGKKKNKKKEKYDWEAIWKDYRAGVLSLREVSRVHGVDASYLNRKAKQLGVKRDLTKRVKQAVNAKIVHGSVLTPNVSDDEIIECESDRVVSVIRLQREDINNLRNLEINLIRELSGNPTKLYMTQYQGKIVEKEVALTASERSMAANNLANVQHKRIQLERQAYNIDGTGDESTEAKETLAPFLKEMMDAITKRVGPYRV